MISFLKYAQIHLKQSYVHLQLLGNAPFWNGEFLCGHRNLTHGILGLKWTNSLSHNSMYHEATLTPTGQGLSDPGFYFQCYCLPSNLKMFIFPSLSYCTLISLICQPLIFLLIPQILVLQNALRAGLIKQDTDRVQLQPSNLSLLPNICRVTRKLCR